MFPSHDPGGGGGQSNPNNPGGNGGSGVVFVRAPTESFDKITITGSSNTKTSTPSPDGSATLLTFNETGTFTIG